MHAASADRCTTPLPAASLSALREQPPLVSQGALKGFMSIAHGESPRFASPLHAASSPSSLLDAMHDHHDLPDDDDDDGHRGSGAAAGIWGSSHGDGSRSAGSAGRSTPVPAMQSRRSDPSIELMPGESAEDPLISPPLRMEARVERRT